MKPLPPEVIAEIEKAQKEVDDSAPVNAFTIKQYLQQMLFMNIETTEKQCYHYLMLLADNNPEWHKKKVRNVWHFWREDVV